MEYLHKSPLRVHGILRSSNCLLNFRWMLKISDFGLTRYRVKSYVSEDDKYTGTVNRFNMRHHVYVIDFFV